MKTKLQNWENFVRQSGRWSGHWLRYNATERRVFANFRGIRDLPLVTPDFMDHTNHYQDRPGGAWRQRAFRGYHRDRNCLSDGISHDDLGADSRGVFFSDNTGIFGHHQLGPMGGLELYMIRDDIRFSVVLLYSATGRPGMISFIREERDGSNLSFWSDSTEFEKERAPLVAKGVTQIVDYPALDLRSEVRLYRSPSPAENTAIFYFPDGVTLSCPASLQTGDVWSVGVEWNLNPAVKVVTAVFNRTNLEQVTSFSGTIHH